MRTIKGNKISLFYLQILAKFGHLTLIQLGALSVYTGQLEFVDKFLSGRRNGFFVECGAADGEALSNSLFFELKRNWTGLLIEANPYFQRALLDKNRRAYVLPACLSTERRPMTAQFLPADNGWISGIVGRLSVKTCSKPS